MKSPDGAISPVASIHVGDNYVDPGRQRVAYAKSLRKKWLDRPGFKPAGKIKYKQPVFQSELDANSDPSAVKTLLKALNARAPKVKKETFAPKNFITTPAKKGSFGVAGTLMPQYAGEANTMWKYQPSEYGRERELEKQRAAKLRAKASVLCVCFILRFSLSRCLSCLCRAFVDGRSSGIQGSGFHAWTGDVCD